LSPGAAGARKRHIPAAATFAAVSGEDVLQWGEGPCEEERFFEDQAESQIRSRQEYSMETLERLGDIMVLLGPRYKTLPRGTIWEKAVEGGLTPYQRQQKRLGAYRKPTNHEAIFCSSRRAPEDRPDLDTEAEARNAWLINRRREKERARARAAPSP